VRALREAFDSDLRAIGPLLADGVRWYGPHWGGGCRSREDVLRTLTQLSEDGVRPRLLELRELDDRALLHVSIARDRTIWIVLTLGEDGLIRDIQQYLSEEAALHDLRVRRDGAAPGPPVSGLVPFVHVTDVPRSVAFYRLLGFEVNDTFEHEGELVWAWLESEAARLMLARGGGPGNDEAVLFYLYSRDLAALRDHLVANGLTPGEIVDGSPGPREEMRVTDPDGYYLMIAQINEDTG
jgi:hypothetical protein